MDCPHFPPNVWPKEYIDNPTLFKSVKIPADFGDDETNPPKAGEYRNVILTYLANNHTYIYSSDGIPVLITGNTEGGGEGTVKSVNNVEPDAAGNVALSPSDILSQAQLAAVNSGITASGVTKLGDLADIKSIGSNLTLNSSTGELSATDTTYSDFSGATSGAAGVAGLVPAPASGETDKYLKSDGSWATVSSYTLPAASANTLGGVKIGSNLSMDANDVLSATDTTYSNFVGTDGTAAGTAGLVPAPATTDAGKVLSASGAWTGLPDGIKTLTTADYNYPADNPTSVAAWLLPVGLYRASAGVSVKISTTDTPRADSVFSVQNQQGQSVLMFFTNNSSIASENMYIWVNTRNGVAGNRATVPYVASLNSVSPYQALAASQGKVLADRIGDLTSLTTTAKTSAVAAINELDSEMPIITMTNTDPGEGSPLDANNFIAYYE